jgi:hypothetical protein
VKSRKCWETITLKIIEDGLYQNDVLSRRECG